MNMIHFFEIIGNLGKVQVNKMEIFSSALHWFSRGGVVMYLLLLCSIMSLTIIIERFKYFRTKAVHAAKFAENLEKAMERDSLHELMDRYARDTTAAGIVIEAGAKALARNKDVELAMENAARLEAAKLRKGISLLGVTVTGAPVIGLLGTVVGMIQSFSVFNLQEGAPMAITGGVGEALVATASGLMVAILALAGHSYFSHRLDGIMTGIEQIAGVFMENLPSSNAGREVGRCA